MELMKRLRDHMKMKHEGLRLDRIGSEFRCEVCGFQTDGPDNFRNHMEMKHEDFGS